MGFEQMEMEFSGVPGSRASKKHRNVEVSLLKEWLKYRYTHRLVRHGRRMYYINGLKERSHTP